MNEEFPLDSLLPAGTVLKKTYEIIRVLGEGGAGAVYEGRHIHLGNPIAIKVLFSELARMSQIRERFVEEGRIQANLRHPNLVAVNDIVEEGSLVAIVMEFVKGETLHHFIQRQTNPINIEKAAGIALRVLAGLDVAHSNSIVHRDIKPGNILLAATEEGIIPKLCDFGIAKVDSSRGLTVSGTKMGTLHYMAPEQFQDARSVDAAADIYSLGVTFYELLTGHLPFDSDNEYALMRAHLDIKPPSPRGYRPDLPEQLDALVLKCMEKRPRDRFSSAKEMAEAILGISEFRKLGDYRSSPTVSEVTQGIQATAMGAPERYVRAATMHSGRPRERSKAPRPRAEKEAQEKTRRGFSGFTVFLGIFAIVLASSVVVFALNQKDRVPLLPDNRPDGEEKPTLSSDVARAENDVTDVAELRTVATAQSCDALSGQVFNFVRAGDPQLSGVLAEALESTADVCADIFLEGIGDSAFDITYSRVRGDILIIARHLSRLGSIGEQESPCFVFHTVDQAYTSTIDRLELALDGGRVSDLESAPLREQRDALVQGQSTLQAYYGGCEP